MNFALSDQQKMIIATCGGSLPRNCSHSKTKWNSWAFWRSFEVRSEVNRKLIARSVAKRGAALFAVDAWPAYLITLQDKLAVCSLHPSRGC